MAYTQAIGPSVDFFVQFTPIWTMFRAEKYPGAQQLSFRASKAVEAGQNHYHSTITSPRWSQSLLVAFTQATGPSVVFFVQFTPISTMFRAEKYPGVQRLIFRASKAVEPGQNHCHSTITSPRWPQSLLVAFIQATGQSVDFFAQFTHIGPCLEPKRTPVLTK